MADCLAIQCGAGAQVGATTADAYACAQSGQSGALSASDPMCAKYYPPVVTQSMPSPTPVLTDPSNPQPLTIYTLTQPSPDIVAAAQGPAQPIGPPSFYCEIAQAVSDHPIAAGVALAVIFLAGCLPRGGGK